MGFQDVLIFAAVVILLALGGRRLAAFGKRLGEGISDHRGGGPGGPKAA